MVEGKGDKNVMTYRCNSAIFMEKTLCKRLCKYTAAVQLMGYTSYTVVQIINYLFLSILEFAYLT